MHSRFTIFNVERSTDALVPKYWTLTHNYMHFKITKLGQTSLFFSLYSHSNHCHSKEYSNYTHINLVNPSQIPQNAASDSSELENKAICITLEINKNNKMFYLKCMGVPEKI